MFEMIRPERILLSYQRCKEITRLSSRSIFVKAPVRLWSLLASWRIFFYYKCRGYRRCASSLPSGLPSNGPIVSLTSFPARMAHLWMVVDLLMRQSVRPSKIVLTLFEGDFPYRRLPSSLEPYLEKGLEVCWSKVNMRSHLKYWEVFQRASCTEGIRHSEGVTTTEESHWHGASCTESAAVIRHSDGAVATEESSWDGASCTPCVPIITVDDDLFYAPDTIVRLMTLHNKYPLSVCANITRRISGDDYALWNLVTEPSAPSSQLLALGAGAVLYPTSVYCQSAFIDEDAIREKAYKADDLWLKKIENDLGVNVVTGAYYAVPPEIPHSQKFSLQKTNVGIAGGNNVAWQALNSPDSSGFAAQNDTFRHSEVSTEDVPRHSEVNNASEESCHSESQPKDVPRHSDVKPVGRSEESRHSESQPEDVPRHSEVSNASEESRHSEMHPESLPRHSDASNASEESCHSEMQLEDVPRHSEVSNASEESRHSESQPEDVPRHSEVSNASEESRSNGGHQQ